MEINKAPEKIYLDKDESWHLTNPNGDSIEYTRTDAFIKKALDYIENNIYDHYDGDNEYGICGGYVKKEEFIEEFVKYMKGE